MKLYHHPLSGHSHRARLLLSLLGIDHDLVEVDLSAAANKAWHFLELNPFGQVPVLIDGDAAIADSNAILVYLALANLGRLSGFRPTRFSKRKSSAGFPWPQVRLPMGQPPRRS